MADVIVELLAGQTGAGHLRLWQNRRGPVLDIAVVIQGHLGRLLGAES